MTNIYRYSFTVEPYVPHERFNAVVIRVKVQSSGNPDSSFEKVIPNNDLLSHFDQIWKWAGDEMKEYLTSSHVVTF
jgi:hypothetical protein